MHADLPIPAPASWRTAAPTDAPVLRQRSCMASRSIPRGLWCIATYSSGASRIHAMQDSVVDEFGDLVPLCDAASAANNDWYASAYAIDQAACEWMDQLALRPGSSLQVMADHVRILRSMRDLPQPGPGAILTPALQPAPKPAPVPEPVFTAAPIGMWDQERESPRLYAALYAAAMLIGLLGHHVVGWLAWLTGAV